MGGQCWIVETVINAQHPLSVQRIEYKMCCSVWYKDKYIQFLFHCSHMPSKVVPLGDYELQLLLYPHASQIYVTYPLPLRQVSQKDTSISENETLRLICEVDSIQVAWNLVQ